MDINNFLTNLANIGLNFGLKIVGSIFVLFIGRWIIRIIISLVRRAMEKQFMEPTLMRYIGSSISIILNLALFIAILGFFGFETTTFAALLAGVGVAIGAAWSGLLSNFAAGIFLVVLRPFAVGDYIQAGSVTGTVTEIGMFITTINTPLNVVTFVGNNKIFSETIENFSTNPYRRVDIKAPLEPEIDLIAAMQILRENLTRIPHVLAEPAPEIGIIELTSSGAILAIRPFTHNNNYPEVQYETNKMILQTLESIRPTIKTKEL
jgi:small conductance mechanosensitive channel